ncbi:hypothetical protein BGZ49_004210 [Haplosporangium sp. Z 27]|nr:hypothetical protein BGZ49_004210 [Haplosporangium sp. Z 27]
MGSGNSKSPSEENDSSESRPLLAHYHSYERGGLPRAFPTAPVTSLVKEARYEIINALDTSLTRKELGSPEIYFALLLPIVRKYREERKETAAAYCFLLNRWQFLKDAESDLANARLNETRAHACEIVATKVLKAFTMRQLIDVLTYDFSPVRQKDARSRLYLPHFVGEPSTEPMSAIEVAISGRAKNFISNPLVQEIINQIWLGEIVFFSNAIDNPRSCLNASQQEIRTVTVYDRQHIKFLRLSRLRVPRYKTTFQMVSFSVFICVYTIVTFEKRAELTVMEVIMDVFALSFTLDEFLQLKDSGPAFYFETVWNIFDVPIYTIFLALHDNTKSYGEIAWLLLQVFFGSAFLGFEQASEISELFGAPLMVLFVAISVLMLYTLLISIFSQTFSEVSANAKEEFMFLFSVKVMEEVKSDALYEFQPPFNILAGIFVWPCSLIYPQQVTGKVSRVLLRIFYFPELACIWLFEILVLRKKPPYVPVRPGHVDHHGEYGGMPPVPECEDESVGGGVAKRRQKERLLHTEDGMFPIEGHNFSSEPQQIETSHSNYSSESSSATPHHQQPQHLGNLNTSGLDPSNAQEVMSPYFENIRKFRNANKNGSVITVPSMQSDNERHTEHAQYSYYASAPIKMGISRHGSLSGYRRVHPGTEATLANTYQGVSSSYHNGTGGDYSSAIGGSFVGDQYPHHHHQLHEPTPQQQLHEDMLELARLMETRHANMRVRMEQIESKLDQLIVALAPKDQKDK